MVNATIFPIDQEVIYIGLILDWKTSEVYLGGWLMYESWGKGVSIMIKEYWNKRCHLDDICENSRLPYLFLYNSTFLWTFFWVFCFLLWGSIILLKTSLFPQLFILGPICLLLTMPRVTHHIKSNFQMQHQLIITLSKVYTYHHWKSYW